MHTFSFLRVNGIIDSDMTYTARTGFETPTIPQSFPRESDVGTPDGYTLSLYDKKGELLWQAPAILYGGNDDFAGSWQLGGYIPLLAAPGYYEIKRYNTVIYRSGISEKPPVIKITSFTIGKSRVSISWEAQPGDDHHDSSLLFNAACNIAGKKFPLLFNSKATSLDIDLNNFPGCAQAEIAVRASDGCRSSVARTEPFAIAPKPPVVKLQSPANESVFDATAVIPLCGTAMEIGMGQLPFSGLQWFIESENDTSYTESKPMTTDNGHLVLSKLLAGRHRIRLVYGDDMHAAETQVYITVLPIQDSELQWQQLFVNELRSSMEKHV